MVIMWPNSDGTITISQRSASGEAMPTLVSNPPRVAAVDAAASDLTASQPTLSFTIPVVRVSRRRTRPFMHAMSYASLT